jgi:hypothetical protein
MNKLLTVGSGTIRSGVWIVSEGQKVSFDQVVCIGAGCLDSMGTTQENHDPWLKQNADLIVMRVFENVPNGTYLVGRYSFRPDGSSRRGKNLKPTASRQERYTKSQKR